MKMDYESIAKKSSKESGGKGKCNQPGTLYDETAFYIKKMNQL